MTTQELQTYRNQINDALDNNFINKAILLTNNLLDECSWELNDEMNRIKLEYKYLVDYFSNGINDPERYNIHNKILSRLYTVSDKAVNEILTKVDYSLYYGIKRANNKSHISLKHLLNDYDTCLSEYLLYSDVSDKDKKSEIDLCSKKEIIEADIFKKIWTSFPLNDEDLSTINSLLKNDGYPDYFKSLVVSAVFMSLLQFYDENLLLMLLDVYNNENDELSLRALCASIIIIFRHYKRVTSSKSIPVMLNSLSEKTKFSNDVKSIFYQLIRSRNTERMSRKVHEELIPKLMKIYPKVFRKFKSDATTVDLTDLESNPQWKEMLDNEGLTKKIDELNKMQLEGGDVFIGTFSHLKTFPFFNEISNWFLPFHKDHSIAKKIFNENENKFISIIIDTRFLCDSDKFSFISSLASVPDAQRSMMLSQFNEQNAEIQELKRSGLPSEEAKRESIISSYIQNLYRLFKLHSRKKEFYDPFSGKFNILDTPLLLSLVDEQELLRLISEFFLKNEYYKDATDYFKELYKLNPDVNSVAVQKIGFCYQNLDKFDTAIEYYRKYELLANNDLWNLRHIASCYRSLKQPQVALEYYKKAVEIAPDNISLCLNIGHCLLELDEYEEALKYYYKVYYLDPLNPRAWRPIAWCLFMQGNYEQSRNYYDKILQNKPTSQDYLNYGHLAFAENNVKEALVYYKDSLNKLNGNIELFTDNYLADINTLVRTGISENDIYILLDALTIS